MHEYTTDALVLSREDASENDARIFLFTKELGRITARAKGVRKISSKLSAHLQPLMISRIRLVEKHGFQIVDALTMRNLAKDADYKKVREFIAVTQLIRQLTSEGHPDADLWSLIETGDLLSRRFLKAMGFDPEHAVCNTCEEAKPSLFVLRDALYMCRRCLGSKAAYVTVSSA